MKYFKQYPLVTFLIIHFLVWSLIPLLRHSLPMDSIEAVVWGQYCDWGTNKHPPLSGVLAYWFYTVGGGSHYTIYMLSQCCVLLAFIYLYKLACLFLDKQKAVLSVMLLEGVIYYGFSALEFNVNVVSLALWPMTIYYFYKALISDKCWDWTLTGLFAGLNLLNKYVSGILLLAMLVFMLCDKTARSKFKTCGPYWCALIAFLVVIPHLCWLYRYDFFVIDYFLGRSGKADFDNLPILRHIVYPLKFFAAQVLFSLGSLLIYFIATIKTPKESLVGTKFQRGFIAVNGLLPLIIMILVSLIGGVKLKSMWGFPVMYMLGIMLMVFFPRQISDKVQAKMMRGVYIIMALLAVAQICIITFNKSDKLHLNAGQYGQMIENLWNNKSNKPFKYVAGDVWWADNVALYAPSAPKPIIWADMARNPWFESGDFATSGALVIAAGKSEYDNMAKRLGNVSEPLPLELEFKNLIGKVKKKTVYYGFYNL